jgi:hypothetical protein
VYFDERILHLVSLAKNAVAFLKMSRSFVTRGVKIRRNSNVINRMVYIDIERYSRWKQGSPWFFLRILKEEGVKFWLEAVTKLKNCGVGKICSYPIELLNRSLCKVNKNR